MIGIGIGGVPGFIMRVTAQPKIIAPYKKNKILICIFQRGAMDGLMAVTPFTDEHLKTARPNLFMSAAKGNQSLIDLDGRFGLHPSLRSFEELFKDKRLAIVHGMGSPNSTRSHFDAQDYMESGTPFSKNTTSGWLNRAAGLLGHDASPFQAVSLTSAMPRILYGEHSAIAIKDLDDFKVQGGTNKINSSMAARSFEELYDETSSQLLKETGKESFDAVRMLQQTDIKNYKPANGVTYPNSSLGNSLKQIAQLIKMDVGVEIAFAESGGWDTHFNQGTYSGPFARNLNDLSESIVALWNDLSSYQDNVTIMTMTEFGRTVKQNGTGGTDHGRASCSFIIGNQVNGGKVHGIVKPLAKENLDEGRDLAVTTDFRSVFSEVAQRHLQIKDGKSLFPEWDGPSVGLIR